MKILLVEDHPSTLDAFHALLELEGYSVDHAENVHSAIVRTKIIKPDVLITDWCMPGDPTITLVDYFHNNYPKIPILITTALDWESVQGIKKLVDGMHNVSIFRKPFEPEDVLFYLKSLTIPEEVKP